MKKGKLWALAALCASVVLSAGTAAACNKHTHNYGDWTFSTAPTEDADGTAKRDCIDGDHTEEVPVAKLTDETVWTLSTDPATHDKDGKKTYTSEYGTVEVTMPKGNHTFEGAEWTITQAPTLENGGKAERNCTANDDGKESKDIPALTDDIWTAEVKTAATHTSEGLTVYTSVYGSVNYTTPKLAEHDYGEWVITEQPTLKNGGKAERKCTANDGGVENAEIPALTDSTVWTRDEASYIAPTDTKPGRATYNSVYGSVTVDLPRLKEPYYNKTYYNFAYYNTPETKNKELAIQLAWDTASLPLDGEGKGVGTGYPYMGETSVVTKDFVTNELEITIAGSKYKAYVDTISGVIVVVDSSYIYVLTPYTREVSTDKYDEETETTTQVVKTHSVSDAKASAWTYINNNGVEATALAIAYNYAEGKTLNIFVDADGAVHFDVTFTDMEGNAVRAENCFNNQFIYVKADKEVIRAFGHDGERMHELDGLEGVYTDIDGNTLYVMGFGMAAMANGGSGEPSQIGEYEIVDGKLHAMLYDLATDNYKFYIITLDGENFTAVSPKVNLTLNYGEFGADEDLSEEVYMNVPLALPVPESKDPTKVFVGWYTDAACEHPVKLTDGKYIPVDAVTLYAKWGTKVVMYYVLENDGEKVAIDCSEGDMIIDRLDAISFVRLDIENNRYFAGWYYNDGTDLVPLPTNAQLDEENNGLTVYAKWEAIPVYYGEYEGSQLLSTEKAYEATLKIDEKGNIAGVINPDGRETKIEGTVKAYNKETQVLIWNPKSDEGKDYIMWFDAESGLIAIPASLDNNVMDTFPFLLSKNGPIDLNQSFDFYDGMGGQNNKTKLVEYENGKLALLYTDKIYGDVSIYNAFGDALTFDTVMASKTLVVQNRLGKVLVAFGAEKDAFNKGGSLSALDAYYGVYGISGKELKLDGLGNIVWSRDKSGTYTFVTDAGDFNEFDVYEIEKTVTIVTEEVEVEPGQYVEVQKEVVTYETVAYYLLKLAKTDGVSSSFEKTEVTISFDKTTDSNADANIPAVNAIVVNKNIATNLPVPASTDASIFWGWYTDPEHKNAVKLEDYIPTDSVTLYAWWRGKVTVTLDYSYDDVEDGKVDVLPGSVAEIERPKRAGYRFDGWYTDAACTEGNEWNSEAEVTDNITIYAKWGVPHVLYGSYQGFEFYNKYSYGTMNQGSYKLEIDEDGYITDSRGVNHNGEPVGFDAENGGAFKIAGKHAYYDKVSGVVAIAWSNSTQFRDDALIYTTKTLNTIDYSVYLNGNVSTTLGSGRLLRFNYADGSTQLFYADNYKICSNVTVEAVDKSGASVTDIDFSTFTKDSIMYFTVKDSSGAVIVKIGNSSSNFVPNDGTEGVFASEGKDNLILSGAGAFIWGDKAGSYIAVDGVENSFVLNVMEEGAVIESYKAIVSDGFYTATENKVTITYVSEHSSHDSVEVWANVVHTLPVPTFEGYHFVGWYVEGLEDTVYETEYTPSASVTLNAKWVVPHSLTGTYKGYEFDSTTLRTSLYTLEVDVFGNVNNKITGSIEDYDEASGTFKVGNRYFYVDIANGTIVTTYTGTSSALTNDVFVFVNGSSVSIASDNTYIYWDNNFTKLAKLTVDGVDKFFFVYRNKVYGNANISVVDSEGNPITAMSAFKTKGNMLTVNDCNNKLIGNFYYDGTTFILNDGTGGTYTGALGEIVSDGYGNLTVNGNTVAYTIADGNLHFIADNAMRIIKLGDGAYTQVQDGYAGVYALPENAGTLTLDGFGGAGDGATYIVDGSNITIYVDGTETSYGIDVENKVLLGKSVFAGLTFTKDKNNTITFDDISQISGKMICGSSVWYVDFIGELNGNILTLTITKQVGTGVSIGGEIELTITGDTMEITKLLGKDSGKLGYTDVAIGYKYTCADFSL